MKNPIPLLMAACAVAAVIVGVLIWRLQRPEPGRPPVSPVAPTAPAPAAQLDAAMIVDSSPSVSEPVTPAVDGPEVLATRRMYMAHASLRTPEVADPDSEANRQILESMVKKALSSESDGILRAP